MAKNLQIINGTVGGYKPGDIVPAYALASANPDWLVKEGFCEWSTATATVTVDASSLAKSAPDASADLVKAHAKLLAQTKEDAATIQALHDKCLDLESKSDALAKEVAAKTVELEAAKKVRDEHAVTVETLKKEVEDVNALLKEADKK
jgi:hypothetical protein